MGARTPTSSATLGGSPSFLASVSSTSPPSLVLGVKALTLPLQSEGLTRLEDVLTHHSSLPVHPPQTRELGLGGSSVPRSPPCLVGSPGSVPAQPRLGVRCKTQCAPG